MFGTAGLPHILMRFYTVPDARTARTSGQLRDRLHRLLLPADLHPRLRRDGAGGAATPSRPSTRAATWRRRCWPRCVGGTGFLGFIAAVAFATILAVVAGLTLSGAAALSHDLWVNVVRGGQAPEQRAAARRARSRPCCCGVLSIVLGHRLQGPERGLHGGPGLRDRGQRQLPGAGAVGLLAAVHHARRPGQHDRRARSRRSLLIFLSPTIQVERAGPRLGASSRSRTPASSRSRSRSSWASWSRCSRRSARPASASRRCSTGCTLGRRPTRSETALVNPRTQFGQHDESAVLRGIALWEAC